jgi:ABC-type branched-subunit amino acid transport system substrate-binding protein
MKKMDLIIGLVYNRNFQIISTFAQKNNIPVVNPISERDQIVEGNPLVFKAMPSPKTRVPELAEYISKSKPDGNIIIIKDVQFKDTKEPEDLRKTLADKSMNARLIDGYSQVFEMLSKEKENILVIFSDNKVFTLEILTKLHEFRDDYRFAVFGMPHWDEMEGLEPEYLVNLNAHMMAPSCIDYDDPEVKKFVSRFQERYKTDPDLLAFQGFDITFYFFTALVKYGKAIDHCLPDLRMKSLQTDFRFTNSNNNGFVNEHWEIYNFQNYKVNKVTWNN